MGDVFGARNCALTSHSTVPPLFPPSFRYKQKDDAIFGTNTANGGPNFVQQMNQPSPEYNLNRLSPDPAVRAQQRQEVSWNDFYYQMLLAGEVQEIVIHSGLPLATVILRPDAVYKGRKVTNNEFKLK